VEKTPEDSSARNVHRHTQAQSIDNSRCLSTAKPERSTACRSRADSNWGWLSLSTTTCSSRQLSTANRTLSTKDRPQTQQ